MLYEVEDDCSTTYRPSECTEQFQCVFFYIFGGIGSVAQQ
ncbi:hypothetical protein ACPOL_4178 [Acidisarcina polymorpha]|uniref:Uncharacterized protein n=1 Tax=Acidisarcina polymorpha TaxID=2211140 RepID=A0A2Z5G462_9BACT|nr:hypothetical protein ACPOL_4178 [Acidisarcina polymorpha]